jgi:hypothetical protein
VHGATPTQIFNFMDKGTLFYVLLLIWLVLGLVIQWPRGTVAGSARYYPLGGNVLLFVLILLLGWHSFGPPIK